MTRHQTPAEMAEEIKRQVNEACALHAGNSAGQWRVLDGALTAIDRLRALANANAEYAALTQAISERDHCREVADVLSWAIAEHLGIDIGEHSSDNDPWRRAYEALSEARPDAEDAARLDWLLPNLHPANFGLDFPGGYEWDDNADFLGKWRAAIDGARKEQACVLRAAQRFIATPAAPVAAQPVVPAGWKIVPVEPTEAMMEAGRASGAGAGWSAAYGFMLAAAPEAPEARGHGIEGDA